MPENKPENSRPNLGELKQKKSWAWVKTALVSVLLIGGLSLVFMPVWPEVELWWTRQASPEKFEITYYDEEKLVEPEPEQEEEPEEKEEEPPKPEPKFFDLVIPSIALDVDILQGESESLMDYGAWLKPKGVNPNQNGNVIITGHRFQYFDGVRPFYHLDKVKVGEEVHVYWSGQKITYKIREKFIVEPTDVWIEDQTETNQLTLYTCEGLDASKRLVVVADRV